MKKKKLSLLSVLSAAVISACSVFGVGCGETSNGKSAQAPDYSSYTHLKFESFGYSGLNDGTWTVDSQVFDAGEDFRSYERFVEYREAGFTIYFAGYGMIEQGYDEADWAEDKKILDDAHAAGLKVMLRDGRIATPTGTKNVGLIGQNAQFKSEAELDAYVEDCVRLYKDHPAFYGLLICDEPVYTRADAVGQMYRALKRVLPDKVVTYNLLPPNTAKMEERYPKVEGFQGTDEEELFARYEKYLELFLDTTGADYVQYDDYPIYSGDNGKKRLGTRYIRGLQIASEVCKERGVELHMVSQTFSMYLNGSPHYAKVDKKTAQWMNNLLLGFGVKQLHYFTYMTRHESSSSGESFIEGDGNSYLTRFGEKTELYYFMQEIMQNNNKFAPTILNFDYQGSRSYKKKPTNLDDSHIVNVDNDYTFKKLKSVSVDKEIAFVSELYDEANGNYMYMVMNVLAPWEKGSDAYQTTEVTFDKGYTHVVVYKNGVGTPQKLDGNKLSVSLSAGEAVFLLPY